MKMFAKTPSNPDATVETPPASPKRDVTLVNKPKKRPDHVCVESDDCTWKIGLTLEEQYDLGGAYEHGVDDEKMMLETFVERMYQSSAVRLTVEIKPVRPGKVFLTVSSGAHFRAAETVSYDDVGQVIGEWIVKSQPRKELIADLVAACPIDEE